MTKFPERVVVISPSSTIAGSFIERLEESGTRFVAVGRRASRELEHFLKVEDFSVQELEAAAQQSTQILGGLDLLVSFVGTHHENIALMEVDPELIESEFERVNRVNVTIPVLITAIFARRMDSERGGHLVHLASNASTLSLHQSHAYTASKHGLLGFVKSAAAELAPRNIRVNCVAPGTLISPLNEDKLFESGQYTARARSVLAHTPSKRFMTLEGVVDTIWAVCMPQRHLTGNIIFCDDGYSIEGHSWPEGNDELYRRNHDGEELQ